MRKNILILTTLLLGAWESDVAADLEIAIGSATIDISSGSGTVPASIPVFLNNTGATDEDAYGYVLLYDVSPVGMDLPLGVSFGSPAATSGGLFPATLGFTIINDGTQAVGDISLAEDQLTTAATFSVRQ